MDAIASINNHKKNFFEFEMTVDGLDAEDAEVRYVIKYKPDFHLTFPCEKAEGDKWSVEIPPIPMLEKTAYNWCIEVVVDGYYFEGAKGMLNVVGAPEVYVKKPDAKKETTESKPAPKPERNDTRTKSREKPIKQLAQEMIEKQQAEKKPVTESKAKKKVAEKPVAKKVETKKPEKVVTEKKVEKKEPLKPEQKAEPKKPLVSPDEVRNIIKESARKAKKKRAKRSAQKPDRSTKVSKKTPVRNEPPKPVTKKKEKPVTEQEIAAKKLLEGLDAPVEDKKPKKKIAVKKGEQVVR